MVAQFFLHLGEPFFKESEKIECRVRIRREVAARTLTMFELFFKLIGMSHALSGH